MSGAKSLGVVKLSSGTGMVVSGVGLSGSGVPGTEGIAQ